MPPSCDPKAVGASLFPGRRSADCVHEWSSSVPATAGNVNSTSIKNSVFSNTGSDGLRFEVPSGTPVEKASEDLDKKELPGQGAAPVTDSPAASSSPGTQTQASNWRTTRTGEHQLMGASIKFFLPKEERERAEKQLGNEAFVARGSRIA